MKNVGQLVINGTVAPGFEPIRSLYERNMRNLLAVSYTHLTLPTKA